MSLTNATKCKAIFLGTGTSDGVPLINCNCKVCRSHSVKDKRLRSSIMLFVRGKSILIDASMDLRLQLLRLSKTLKIPQIQIDALLLTHPHFDHFFGLSEIRPLTKVNQLKIYCCSDTASQIKKKLDYFFDENIQKGGGIPQVLLNCIDSSPFYIEDILITPLPLFHGKLPIFGYRIGDLAYITDASFIPDETIKKIMGVNTLVINGLRETPHPTHYCIQEAIDVAKKVRAKKTFFTHIAHNHTYKEYNKIVKKLGGRGMISAYDELEFDFSV